MTTTDEGLRYPVGRFSPIEPFTNAIRDEAIQEIAALPAKMRSAVSGLTDAQLDTTYRSGGWTVRQVVHHVPDSHLNAYVRMKLALTEDAPTIKPYDEAAWARLPDSQLPIDVSLQLLESIHARWVTLYRALDDAQWKRTFVHPEFPDGPLTIAHLVQSYAWHSRHHVAHITGLRRREGW